MSNERKFSEDEWNQLTAFQKHYWTHREEHLARRRDAYHAKHGKRKKGRPFGAKDKVKRRSRNRTTPEALQKPVDNGQTNDPPKPQLDGPTNELPA